MTMTSDSMSLQKFRHLARTYVIVAGAIGAGLLWLYGQSGQIGLLLWGLSAILMSVYAFISLFTTTEKDMQWHTQSQVPHKLLKYGLAFSPFIVLFGLSILPESSPLLDDFAILNMFGVFGLAISVAAIPYAIWKVGKTLIQRNS